MDRVVPPIEGVTCIGVEKHELIKQIGEKIEGDLGIRCLYDDFRPDYYDGKNEAKSMGLYSQKYCGCIFSEKERYLKKAQVENLKGT